MNTSASFAYDSEDTGSEMSDVDESPVVKRNSFSAIAEEGIPMYSILAVSCTLTLF